jgi:hypothetical protein
MPKPRKSRGPNAGARCLALVAAVSLLVASSAARAFGPARENFGVGIGSGTIANGLSLKLRAGEGSFQGVLGFWGGRLLRKHYGVDGVAGSLDYLFEMPSLARSAYFSLDWSFGLGAGLGVRDTRGGAFGLGASGIAGLEFNFTKLPLDLTIEYRPTLRILPDPDLHLIDFSAHLRLWF